MAEKGVEEQVLAMERLHCENSETAKQSVASRKSTKVEDGA